MYKVLFVDDEPWVPRGLAVAIDWKSLGFEVLESVGDGYEALEAIRLHDPDLVLMDISMPEMTGLECVRRAREMGTDCLFIVLSGYAEFSYAQESMELGVISYLLKPYDKQELAAAVAKARDMLNRRQPRLGRRGGRYDEILANLIQHVEEHYSQEIRLADIAKRLYIRADYLSSIFKREMGIGFGEYLYRKRMAAAAELLIHDNRTVAEVAAAVGYSDGANFTRSFRRHFNISPARYRQQHRRGEVP